LNKISASKPGNDKAFTLIELIVVISLISIVLAFALPKLNISFGTDQERKLSAWIVLTVKSLKENALREQIPYILYLDFDNQQMWTAKDAPAEEKNQEETAASGKPDKEKEIPQENKYLLPQGYKLMDVAFTDDEKIREGIVPIHFYPKGYSDKAIIHIQDADDNRYSYLVESFLPHVKISEEYIEF
jgi:prepilin-type N-terminal cleavage/methylation domain-containing protein